jgi:hypothetical protein
MGSWKYHALDRIIIEDARLRFTAISYFLVLVFYVNLNLMQSFAIGLFSFILYFLINETFLAHFFFENEALFFRLMFGALLLIMLLGFVGWLIMIIYNLDAELLSITLLVTATISSVLNRKSKRQKNVPN